jgi:hypothetical protein
MNTKAIIVTSLIAALTVGALVVWKERPLPLPPLPKQSHDVVYEAGQAYPWFVRIPSAGMNGVLVHPRMVLSVQHGSKHHTHHLVGETVFIGSTKRNGEGGDKRTIIETIAHPEYMEYGDEDSMINDLVLFVLDTPSSKRPVKLSKTPSRPGDVLVALGYIPLTKQGRLTDHFYMKRGMVMHEVSPPLSSTKEHQAFALAMLSPSVMCISSSSSLPWYCEDSGGAILNSREQLVGLHSFGPRDVNNQQKKRYTWAVNVPHLSDWISRLSCM